LKLHLSNDLKITSSSVVEHVVHLVCFLVLILETELAFAQNPSLQWTIVSVNVISLHICIFSYSKKKPRTFSDKYEGKLFEKSDLNSEKSLNQFKAVVSSFWQQ